MSADSAAELSERPTANSVPNVTGLTAACDWFNRCLRGESSNGRLYWVGGLYKGLTSDILSYWSLDEATYTLKKFSKPPKSSLIIHLGLAQALWVGVLG